MYAFKQAVKDREGPLCPPEAGIHASRQAVNDRESRSGQQDCLGTGSSLPDTDSDPAQNDHCGPAAEYLRDT